MFGKISLGDHLASCRITLPTAAPPDPRVPVSMGFIMLPYAPHPVCLAYQIWLSGLPGGLAIAVFGFRFGRPSRTHRVLRRWERLLCPEMMQPLNGC
jgi:hypothetical protein